VLLPGDPHRALAVAQALLDAPKMFNHARGLWGYTGTAADGEPLTVQATGIGGPSAAIVCEELIALGARRLVRVGTCRALTGKLEPGTLLAAETVLPLDGTSGALGAAGPLGPDPLMLERLVAAGARRATVVSTDLFYDPRPGGPGAWTDRGAVAVEMQSAAVLQVSARRGARAAAVLSVSSAPSPDGPPPAEREAQDSIALRLGAAGYAALRTR